MRARFSLVAFLSLLVALLIGCGPAVTMVPSAAPPTEPESTATAVPSPAAPTSAVPAIVDVLQGLSIDEFFEASYRQLLLRDPDTVIELGLAGELGINKDRFTDLSDAHVRETQQLEVAILELLRSYDRASLTSEQQLSYDIYEWYLDDQVRGHEFMYDDYTVHSFSVWSYHNWAVDFMINVFPIENRQDAADYVARISHMDAWMDQLLEGLRLREQAGVVPPRFMVEDARLQALVHIGTGKADDIELYTSFRDRLNGLPDLTAAEVDGLLASARTAVEEVFVPAYQELADYLSDLATVATDDDGAWKFPNGVAYYAYVLRSSTTTDMSAGEMHELGLAEVARIQAEMRRVAAEDLGYPADVSMGELNDRLWTESPFYAGSALQAEFDRLITEADVASAAVLSLRPAAAVKVEPGPPGAPACYRFPSLDGSRPGVFFAPMDSSIPHFVMPSTTYHEAIPGHHTQAALAFEMDLPTFRRVITIDAYVEGWALYAERLAWEMGLYDDDPMGSLGRLQMELMRAVRVVVDTGIHDRRWTWQQAADYWEEALGWSPGKDEMARYIAMPGQGVSYTIGYLKIVELRQRAQETLGDSFDLKEFHDVVLGHGPMPLGILERVVDEWLAERGGSAAAAPILP